MRARRVLGVGCVGCVPLLVAGCFSSSNPPGAAPGEPLDDAATVSDATIVDTGAPETSTTAPPPDAQAEAGQAEAGPPIEAGPPTVTVHVVNDFGPEANVTILYQDGSGAIALVAVTDGSGATSQVVPADSQVTVVLGTPSSPQLVTVEGVQPGDVLTAYDPTSSPYANGQVSIDSLPDESPPPGTVSYQANVGRCGQYFTSVPQQFSLSADCQNRGTFPLLIQAVGGADAGYANLGYLSKNDNVLPTDGGVAHVTPTGPWSTATGSQDVTLSNVPSLQGSYYPTAGLSELADGVPFAPSYSSASTDDGGVTETFPWHPGYPTALQSEGVVSVNLNDYSQLSVSTIATRGAPPNGPDGSTSLDLSTLLPLIDSATVDSSVAARPSVSWTTEAGSLASADGAVVVLGWTSTDDGGNGIQGTWTVIAPPTAASVQVPALSASTAAWAPSPDATFATPLVMVVEGSFLSGYAQLRSQFASLPPSANLTNGESYGPIAPPLPVDGTLRLTAFTTNGD